MRSDLYAETERAFKVMKWVIPGAVAFMVALCMGLSAAGWILAGIWGDGR